MLGGRPTFRTLSRDCRCGRLRPWLNRTRRGVPQGQRSIARGRRSATGYGLRRMRIRPTSTRQLTSRGRTAPSSSAPSRASLWASAASSRPRVRQWLSHSASSDCQRSSTSLFDIQRCSCRICRTSEGAGRSSLLADRTRSIGDGSGEAEARLIVVSRRRPLLRRAAPCARGALVPPVVRWLFPLGIARREDRGVERLGRHPRAPVGRDPDRRPLVPTQAMKPQRPCRTATSAGTPSDPCLTI